MVRLAGIQRTADVADLEALRDLHLIRRVALGDEAAFAELFGRCGPPAFSLALRMLGDRGLAEEVLQEVFLGVWRRAGMFDFSRGSVRTWLLTQIHHRAVDAVRREDAARRRSTTNLEPSPPPTQEDVIEEQWLAARRSTVRRALVGLPEEQRTVIELCYFEGLTQAQAASRLNVPLGTVKSRTLAAMKRLRRRLHGGEDE